MKTLFKSIPFLLATVLLFAACSGGGETATISINIGKSSLPDKASVSIDQLHHVIVLSGPTGKQTYSISGGGTVKATVTAGLWVIDVDGFLGTELYAKGSATAEVKPARNTSVTVYMTVIWDEPAGGGGGGSSGSGSVPWQFTASSWQALKDQIENTGMTSGTINLVNDPLPVLASPWAADTTNGTITIVAGQNISLMAASGVTITRDGSWDQAFFSVASGGTLKLLSGITVDGTGTAFKPLIEVNSGALEMNAGVTLQYNQNTVTNGGAVAMGGISSVPASFTMYGGQICLNDAFFSSGQGGGVYVGNYAVFTMKNGIIDHNRAGVSSGGGYGGGVFIDSTGEFIMEGGDIDQNEAIFGSGSGGDGGGVYVEGNGTFSMKNSSSKITFNIANRGGGVYVDGFVGVPGKFTMGNGSIISGNIAYGEGGGVGLASDTEFYMYDATTTISGNNAAVGGGVAVGGGGYFEMNNGTIGPGNSVDGTGFGIGGGVYVGYASGNPGQFTMNGGTISGNMAGPISSARGGGVYIILYGIFNYVTGFIYGDDAPALSNYVIDSTYSPVPFMGHAVWDGNASVGLEPTDTTY